MEEPRSSAADSAECANNTATESEMTNAQGDKMTGGAEDREAMQHDVSTTAESIDSNSESQLHTVGEGDGEDFDDMIEQRGEISPNMTRPWTRLSTTTR